MFYSSVTLTALWVGLIAFAAICMIKMSASDWQRRIIPDMWLFPTIITGLVLAAYCPWWPTDIATAVIGGAFGYMLAVGVGAVFARTTKNTDTPPIGMGDIKLMFAGGIWLGTGGLAWALGLTCIGAIIWARHNHARYVPFAPFFICGGILAFIGTTFLL